MEQLHFSIISTICGDFIGLYLITFIGTGMMNRTLGRCLSISNFTGIILFNIFGTGVLTVPYMTPWLKFV